MPAARVLSEGLAGQDTKMPTVRGICQRKNQVREEEADGDEGARWWRGAGGGGSGGACKDC